MLLALLAGLLAHSVNMFGYPLFLGDEGIVMQNAWAVLRQGFLTPYTYWYDNPPAGWILVAAWTALTGGFHTFGSAVDGGRVLMLVLHGLSIVMVFRITVTINPDGTWSYDEDTVLQVEGRDEPFHHTDVHTLHKVAEPTPNPLARV